MSKTTKTVSLSQEFLRAAAGHEEDALAYQLYAAFGVSLTSCYEEAIKAIMARDAKVIVLMMTSGVQIRGNVVFVGAQYGDVRLRYPTLIIEGNRPQQDIFNFGALHVCGHILASITKNPMGAKITGKAGNCVLGGGFTENDAGKINKEIFGSWPGDEVTNVSSLIATQRGGDTKVLDDIVASFATMRKNMIARLSPSTTATTATTAAAVTATSTKAGT